MYRGRTVTPQAGIYRRDGRTSNVGQGTGSAGSDSSGEAEGVDAGAGRGTAGRVRAAGAADLQAVSQPRIGRVAARAAGQSQQAPLAPRPCASGCSRGTRSATPTSGPPSPARSWRNRAWSPASLVQAFAAGACQLSSVQFGPPSCLIGASAFAARRPQASPSLHSLDAPHLSFDGGLMLHRCILL